MSFSVRSILKCITVIFILSYVSSINPLEGEKDLDSLSISSHAADINNDTFHSTVSTPQIVLNISIVPIYNDHPLPYCGHELTTREKYFAAFKGVVMLCGIIGNSLTISIVVSSRRMKKMITFNFICSLAMVDLLTSIFISSSSFISSLHNGNFCLGETYCKIIGFMDTTFNCASITHLMVIALDRFTAITFPYFYGAHMTAKKARKISMCLWLYGMFWASLGTFSWPIDPLSQPHFLNYGLFALECVSNHKYYATLLAVIVYFIQMCSTAVLYALILHTALKHRKAIMYLQPANQPHARKKIKKDMKAFQAVIPVFIAYIVCWTPLFSIVLISFWDFELIINLFNYDISVYDGVLIAFTVVLPTLNSCINPILYCLSSGHFRIAFVELWDKILKKPRNRLIHPIKTTASDVTIGRNVSQMQSECPVGNNKRLTTDQQSRL